MITFAAGIIPNESQTSTLTFTDHEFLQYGIYKKGSNTEEAKMTCRYTIEGNFIVFDPSTIVCKVRENGGEWRDDEYDESWRIQFSLQGDKLVLYWDEGCPNEYTRVK